MSDIKSLEKSWRRHLRAQNRTDETVSTYVAALERLTTFLENEGESLEIGDIKKRHVESFIGHLFEQGRKPAGVANRFRSLQQFFRWAVEEGEIEKSPMNGMKVPTIPETPPEVLTDKEIKKLLAACNGKNFFDRRDYAIIRVWLSTGCRKNEMASMLMENLDMDNGVILVIGKGRKPRYLSLSRKCVLAIDRYLRVREKHNRAKSPYLWIGTKNDQMGSSSLQQMLNRRAKEAELDRHIYPHIFRHTFAHNYQREGGNESNLMILMGWKSRSMLNLYAKSAATERAIEEAKKLQPGDKF